MLQVEEHSNVNQVEEGFTSKQLPTQCKTTVAHTTTQDIEYAPSKVHSQEYGVEDDVKLESTYEPGPIKEDCRSVDDCVLEKTEDDHGYKFSPSTEPGETPVVQENVPKKDYTSVDDCVHEKTEGDQGYKFSPSIEPGQTPVVQENVSKKDYTSVDDCVLEQTEDGHDYKLPPVHEPSIKPDTLVATDATDYGSEKRRESYDRTISNIADCMSGCCLCFSICFNIILVCLGEDPS